MILGDICTRGCRFCATKTGRPLAPDAEEPRQVAESVALMKLRYVVVTSVTRDDLPDGGAAHWAATVEAIRTQNPDAVIELLIPDLDARPDLLEVIVASKPDIIGHNIETVERLTPVVRSRAKYRTSLETLRCLNRQGVVTKSGLMVGLGESDDEVLQTLHDLRDAGVRIVTLGQYLRPTLEHYPCLLYTSCGFQVAGLLIRRFLFEKEQAYSLLFLFDRECRECAANTRQIRRKHRKRQREEGRGVRKGVPTDQSRG